MSPADITAGAEFRAGLVRRLVEVGLLPREQAVTPLPTAARAAEEHRKAA